METFRFFSLNKLQKWTLMLIHEQIGSLFQYFHVLLTLSTHWETFTSFCYCGEETHKLTYFSGYFLYLMTTSAPLLLWNSSRKCSKQEVQFKYLPIVFSRWSFSSWTFRTRKQFINEMRNWVCVCGCVCVCVLWVYGGLSGTNLTSFHSLFNKWNNWFSLWHIEILIPKCSSRHLTQIIKHLKNKNLQL